MTIPPNTTAEVVIPVSDRSQITESGKQIDQISGLILTEEAEKALTLVIGSGSYLFKFEVVDVVV
ncbi:hypothetical protein D3C86_2145590 [compost metagenome]